MRTLVKKTDKNLKDIAASVKQMFDDGYSWRRVSHSALAGLNAEEISKVEHCFKLLTCDIGMINYCFDIQDENGKK